MLKAGSDAAGFAARLDVVPEAVRAAVEAYVRARSGGASKLQAVRAYAARKPAPRRAPAPRAAARDDASPAALKAAAVKAAMTALGKS